MKKITLLSSMLLFAIFSVNIFAATYTVTNTNDSGAGSLRQAITDANSNAGVDTINFGIAGTTPHTISPTSQLTTITEAVVIDAGTNHEIILNGSSAGDVYGLYLNSNGSTIKGLVINSFNYHGIRIFEGDYNVIIGCYIGTDHTGTVDQGNSMKGISMSNSDHNTIGGTIAEERNIISGNVHSGILLYESHHNIIQGNYIGVDATGNNPMGNDGYGIDVYRVSSYNIIGGTVPGSGNVISDNHLDGIIITYEGSDHNRILGNYIGTNAAGNTDLGNGSSGICLSDMGGNGCPEFCIIGGDTPEARNIISGNNKNGIEMNDEGADNHKILGNYIGTDATGTVAIGNTESGIRIFRGEYNIIGSTVPGAGNIISGNGQYGINITGSGTNNNQVLGNYIGTDVNGTADLGNSQHGLYIDGGAQSNTIGGIIAGAGNIISGNGWSGVSIRENGTNNNGVLGNYIGTDVTGTVDLGNSSSGIFIMDGAQSNTIGGTVAGAKNIISGNNQYGILIWGSGTDNNVVLGNYIGTDVNGTADLGNSSSGVCIVSSASSNTIGGTIAGAMNLISGNAGDGVHICVSGTNNNVILGNYIGTDVTGTADLGNIKSGVYIYGGAHSNTIGGTDAGARNIISGNDWVGVWIINGGTDNNVILGNYIGTDVTGTTDLGDTVHGVYIGGGAKSNTIGGTVAGAGNIISGHNIHGVYISGADDNVIFGNYIGTDVTGTADLGNSAHGVYIRAGSQSNTIGGTISGMANIIAFNGGDGVYVYEDGSDNNRISGNSIFSNAGLGIDLAADGVNSNDAGDTDTGPNENLNFPVITEIIQTGIDTYTINGTAGASIEIELYIVNNSTASVTADPTGYGEGYYYYTTTNTDGSGNFSLEGESLSGDVILTSLAIDGTGNTSEFGANRAILNGLTSVINDDAPTTAVQGAEVLMSNFTLSADADNAFWTDITVEGNGTNVDSDVSSIKIYADNGNSIYSSAEDTLLGSGTFVSGLVDINITDQNIITASYVYFIVIDLDPVAAIGNTFTISISDSSNFTIMSPDQMAAFTPFLSGSVTITDSPDPITVLPVDLAAAAAKAGAQDLVFEQLSLSTAFETAALSAITVDLIGTADDNDVSGVKVYLDNGDDSFSVADDTLIGTGTFTSGTADIDIVDQIISTTAKTYFLCLDISADAVNGHTIGISCVDTTYFTVLLPDTVSEANLPFESGLTLIKSYADTLEDILIYPNPWNKDLSGEYVTFSRLTEDVTIRIYTVAGELVLETDADGQSEWEWNLANEDGEDVAAGIYFCHISNDADETKVLKVAVIK